MQNSSFLSTKNQRKNNLGEPYLKVQLDEDTTAILPMKDTQEVFTIANKRITVIPNMPNYIYGLINQRSRVFWVIDLPELLELEPTDKDAQQYNIVVVKVANIFLGLVVKKIMGVIRFSADLIQSPVGNTSAGITPYLRGCLLQEREISFVLDTATIVHSPSFNN